MLDAANRPIAAFGAGGGYRIVGMVANLLLPLAGGARDAAAVLAARAALERGDCGSASKFDPARIVT